jgi:hypothetical protein
MNQSRCLHPICSPVRVQLSRRKGWRMPANTVKVCRPGQWGNPYKPGDVVAGVGMVYGRAGAVDFFRRYCFPNVAALRGKNLACWCPLNEPCHADVLLHRANVPDQATASK